MGAVIKRNSVNAIIAAAILIALTYLGVPKMLGAHPQWAVKVGYFGIVAGIIFSSIVWIWRGGWGPKFILFLILGAVFGGIVTYSKARFVNSFAEDILAGQFWYFGWIGLMGFVFSILFHLLALRD